MSTLITIPVSSIVADPAQPRRKFDKAELLRLATSIQEKGLIQPIVVRPDGDRYILVAGERRWRAVKLLKWESVAVACIEATDSQAFELAVAENTVRANLTPLEEALAYRRLREDHRLTLAETAATAGVSPAHVSEVLRILDLPASVQAMFDQGGIPLGAVPVLLQISSEDSQKELARHLQRGMSIREAGDWAVRKAGAPPKPPKGGGGPSPYKALEDKVIEDVTFATEWRCVVRRRGRSGVVCFPFKSLEELVKLRRRLCRD